ncbi:MAG: ABC transporter ATP-binding protein [Bacteroidales bacterium]|nr:ABC transporter ATP-binding protein [Bacteroidales bacterium]
MTEIIKTQKLSKYFPGVQAVDDLSLNIREGEVYGFLGLNGAGKTTTIRMLLGLIQPSSGASFIVGKQIRPGKNDIWKDIGYLVEIPYSYPELTVRENLEIIRRMRLIPDKKAVERIIDKLQLGEYADRRSKNLSHGNSQRLGLAKALIHNPRILILDEPTNGLDPAGIVEIRELLKDLSMIKGATIFISSHILGEISKLATRIGIIHEGHLMQEINTDQLDRLCRKRLLIDTSDQNAAVSILSQTGYAPKVNQEGTIELKDEIAINHPEEAARSLVNAGIDLTLLKVDEEDLESFFLRTIGITGGAK